MPIVGLDLSDQQIFDGLSLVLPAWILLVIAPRWRVTHWIVNFTTFCFAALYTGLFVTLMLQSETTFDFKVVHLHLYLLCHRALTMKHVF